jgi:tripartite-type tricarboxylate transporter receptor subunit TctC
MLIAACLLACGAAQSASAQTYPSRPARIVVGFAPGGTNDILARLIAQWLTERLGQPFVVENRPGAAGNIATDLVVRSLPDGHTLLFTGVNNAINATLYENLSFNFVRDVAPVASVVRQPFVMLANPAVPAETVPALIAYAKANPAKLNIASSGVGTGPHVVGELFKMMTGVNMVHVHYRGAAPVLSDLLGGQVQIAFESIILSIDHIKTRKLRPLAVTEATPSDVLPSVPPMNHFVPGFEASAWFGIVAPKGTPIGVVETLNREINAGLADPALRARLAGLGSTAFAGSPAEFGKFIAEETQKWGKVVRFSGAKPD